MSATWLAFASGGIVGIALGIAWMFAFERWVERRERAKWKARVSMVQMDELRRRRGGRR